MALFTPRQLEEYNDQGFTTVESFLDPESLEVIRGVFARCFEGRAGMPVDVETVDKDAILGIDPEQMVEMIQGAGRYIEDYINGRVCMRHLTYFDPLKDIPEIFQTRLRANLIEAAKALLDIPREELTVFACMLWKPPGGTATTWHQEDAFDRDDAMQCTVGCWVALADASEENGCMRVIPHSHVGPLRPHPVLGRAEVSAEEESRAVSVPLPAGGALFFNGRLIHGSNPNTSDRPRQNLSVVLRSPWLRSPESHIPHGRHPTPRGGQVPASA